MKKIVSLLICLMLLISCKSTQKIISVRYAGGIENIKHNLELEKIDEFEAYILTEKLLNKYKEDDAKYQEAKEYLDYIVLEMNKKADNKYEENKLDDTLKYVLSLKEINKNCGISLQDVYLKISDQFDASSDIFTRLKIKREMADLNLLKEKDVYNLLKIYADNKSVDEFSYLYKRYAVSYPNLVSIYPELNSMKINIDSKSDLNFKELMKSVVTVILDKGLNIRRGMGYNDRPLGTGFFIDDAGHILTNYHVIADHVDPEYEGYSKVYVTTLDEQKEIPAKVIGYDKVFDIALLEIPIKSKDYMVLGRSDEMQLGDKIFTIGNPFGIKNTITSGIISNRKYTISFQLGSGFQIDAAINPGNSGGPLIDDRGQVVGIVFAGLSKEMSEGINFAIPSEWVKLTLPGLFKGGEVKRCWMGAALYDDKDKVYFYYVLPSGPALKSGIEVGDRLISIDGEKVDSVEEAQSRLAWKRFPMLISVEIERKGEVVKKIIRLEERPFIPVETAFERDTEANIITLLFGIGLEYYDKKIMSKKYKIEKIYSKLYNFPFNIGEGDQFTVYDIRYIEKSHLVSIVFRYMQNDIKAVERVVNIAYPAEINSII